MPNLKPKPKTYQLVVVGSSTKCEKLATGSNPRLPVLINSGSYPMSQNCEILGYQWPGVKRIKSYFRE